MHFSSLLFLFTGMILAIVHALPLAPASETTAIEAYPRSETLSVTLNSRGEPVVVSREGSLVSALDIHGIPSASPRELDLVIYNSKRAIQIRVSLTIPIDVKNELLPAINSAIQIVVQAVARLINPNAPANTPPIVNIDVVQATAAPQTLKGHLVTFTFELVKASLSNTVTQKFEGLLDKTGWFTVNNRENGEQVYRQQNPKLKQD